MLNSYMSVGIHDSYDYWLYPYCCQEPVETVSCVDDGPLSVVSEEEHEAEVNYSSPTSLDGLHNFTNDSLVSPEVMLDFHDSGFDEMTQ